MSDWKAYLKADTTDWLLEEDNPSVRYLTMTEILDMPVDGAAAQKAKAAIMKTGVVPQILAKQEEGGYWDDPEKLYVAKYKGTVWQLIILAEHQSDGEDERIQKACEFLLEYSQDIESGGFSMHRAVKMGGGRHSEVIPCLTGNMVWSLLRFGFLSDPRVQRGIDWITQYQRFDDAAESPPTGWPYDKAEPCWGKHTCHMGAVKALKALAEIPVAQRPVKVQSTLQEGVEFILCHHVHKRSHDLARVSKPGWLRFGFPLMYQTDVLEILGILTQLGCRDARMQEAVDAVVSKQDSAGRWKLADTFNGRFQVDIEEKGKPSKWITLRALSVLKQYYG
ncbi:MAG: nitrogen fixation protein NifH [Dehalococcoidia bacterium]|nr:nitrogen fixation protein NifH [Dehalococcoidia bacterium]